MNMLKNPLTYVGAYFLVFVVTYGHAFNNILPGVMIPVGERALGAFLVSVPWPLYWSVQIWS